MRSLAPALRSSLALALLLPAVPAAAVSFDWVAIGDPGNACDTQSQGCFGSVAREFSISRTEVTNTQYAAFLNAVAAADPNGLYSASMDSAVAGGIARSGSPGSYSYQVKTGFADRPVTYVTFWDTLRFANWLHNGQPGGPQGALTTEDGAYTLTLQAVADNSVSRNPGALFAVPDEHEWYKAAYFDGASYLDYPTGSDLPTLCTSPGATAHTANCGGAHGSLSDVGSYTGSASPYGTFDQGGNVWEWIETVHGVNRVLRGGSFDDNSSASPLGQHNLAAMREFLYAPDAEDFGVLGVIGFRVALVPEPGTGLLVAAGLLVLGAARRTGRGAGGVAIACLLTVAPGADVASAQSCPATGDVDTELLMSRDALWSLQRQMVDLGVRETGSPAHEAWIDAIEAHLVADGLAVERIAHPLPQRWDHTRWSLHLIEGATETEIPVSSYYPYSGHTPAGGVVGELADGGAGLPSDFAIGDFQGKIALVQEPVAPTTVGELFYPQLFYQHDPDLTLHPLTEYKRAWTTILNPQNSVVTPQTGTLPAAHAAGAAGVIIALDLSAENTAGQYTPLWWDPTGQEIPALFVDRDTGALLAQKVAAGASVRLELQATVHLDESVDELVATLPGTNPDEVIIVNTHSDGPSASEENGTIGLLAMARYFASLPLECRQRTLVFLFEPGHFHTATHAAHSHDALLSRSVASVTLEHLGQLEWADDALGYHPTGLYEPMAVFCSDTPILQLAMDAVVDEDLRRILILRPYAFYIYFGVGAWLHQAGVPNCSYIAGPNQLLSWADDQHIAKTDPDRMRREVSSAIRLTSRIDVTDAVVLGTGSTTGLGLGL